MSGLSCCSLRQTGAEEQKQREIHYFSHQLLSPIRIYENLTPATHLHFAHFNANGNSWEAIAEVYTQEGAILGKLIATGVFLTALSSLGISGCTDSDKSYDSGYSDGYAVGYNTACQIRATLIEGDWDNAAYSRGYAEGQSEGTIACNNDRESGEVE